MIFEGRIVYCKTAIEAEQAALDLYDKIKARKQNEDQISCGFDIEWRPTFRQGAFIKVENLVTFWLLSWFDVPWNVLISMQTICLEISTQFVHGSIVLWTNYIYTRYAVIASYCCL